MTYITLKDIAVRANVSVNTVSRALKGRSDISIKTQERIRRLADELGYIPNATASRLRSGKHRMIGVVITHIDNSFYARILQGINDAVSETGYTILALGSGEDLEREREILRTLGANRVAGMIIVPSRDRENTLDYDRLGVPHITIVRKGNRNTRSYFINDSYKSGVLAANHFGSVGCRNPAYLGFDLPVSCNEEREKGYRRTLEGLSIPLLAHRIVHCRATERAAYEATKDLLQRDPNIDSLFAYNDLMAMGALRAIHDQGLRIPEGIRLLGHDDVAAAPFYIPALSTIRVPKYRLGYESAKELVELIGDSGFPEKRLVFEPELIVRET